MKTLLYTLTVITALTAIVTTVEAANKMPRGLYAVISPCKTTTRHYVKMGSRIKPSNTCRVVNYYVGKEWQGAVSIPLGQDMLIQWGVKYDEEPEKLRAVSQ